ncbi:MAG: DMT family transporter [Dehalococcoidia bacterium]
MRDSLSANIAAVAAFSLFGGAVVATRVVAQDVPPLTLATLRIGLGAAVVWALLPLLDRGGMRIRRSDIGLFVVLAAVYFALFPAAMAAGLRLTEASRGALMQATMPLWSVALARMAGRERLSRRQVAGVLISVSGIGLVFADRAFPLDGSGSATLGNGLLLFSALCVAVYGVLSQRAFARYSAPTVTAYTMLIGTVMLLPFAIAETVIVGPGDYTAQNVSLLVYLGSLGLAQLMFVFALTRLTPTQVTVAVNVSPLVATLLGAALLDEALTGAFAAGFVAVLAGVVMVNWPARRSAGHVVPAETEGPGAGR